MPAIANVTINGTTTLYVSVSYTIKTALILTTILNRFLFLRLWLNGYSVERQSTILRLVFATVIVLLLDFSRTHCHEF